MELPFYERYPEKYIFQEGVCVFSDVAYLNEDYDKWLPESYFPIVGTMRRFPRYKNKRAEDPFIRMFLDEYGYETSGEWVLPMPNQEAAYKSLSKYAKDMPVMEDYEIEIMNKAWEMTAEHFGVYMQNSRVREYAEVVGNLDYSTSSGAPFNVLYKTKKELFDNDPEIHDFLVKDWELLADDPNWTCLCTNSLKEELRPDEKAKANKIRTFTAMATDATVHGNRLFADMNEKMNDSHLRSSSTVGFSPMRGGWNRLIKKLSVFPNGYALDESEYDSSLRSYMMWGCARFRWNCLREEDKTAANLRRIKTFYRNLINTLIITPTGVLVMKKTGNPSGSCNTINDNTLVLHTLLCYAWIKRCPYATNLQDFEMHTAKCLCGDDNTWTVSDEAHSFYNAKTIIETWKEIGITTTTDSLEPRPADELDYLSAHTIYVQGVAVPQYDKDKIMTSLLYSNKTKQTPAQALERANGMLCITYCDKQMRSFVRKIQQWLLEEYDAVCAEDADWILAKSGMSTDAKLNELWIGKSFILPAQAVCIEKRNKDNKCSIKMNTKLIIKNPKPSRRGGRGGRKGPKATRRPQIQVSTPWLSRQQLANAVIGKQPKFKSKRRNRNNNDGGFFNVKRSMGRGATKQTQLGMEVSTFSRDEYVAEVIGSATAANFQSTPYPVNPGQSKLFPWLAGVIGNKFEKYQFEYLEFYVKREGSEFATGASIGKVGLSLDTDASDPPPTSKQQAMDTHPQCNGMPCENIRLVIPRQILRRFNDGFYVRPGGLPGASDIKTYDIGNLNVWTQNLGAASFACGELHVRYRVKVFIPVLESSTSAPANNQVSVFASTAAEALTTNVGHTVLFPDVTSGSGFTNPLAIVNTNGSFVPPPGNYNVVATTTTSTTGNGTVFFLGIQKNGAYINESVGSSDFSLPSAAYPSWQNNVEGFISCNGSDVITVIQQNIFSTGAENVVGVVIFTAL